MRHQLLIDDQYEDRKGDADDCAFIHGSKLLHRIITARMPGVTTENPADSEDNSFEGSVSANGLFGIGGAAWVESTGARQERGDHASINQNEPGQNCAEHFSYILGRLR